ncbi:MAG: class I SAM-dependent methyltransferase [Nanopusillaceae archaeon]
MKRTFDYLIIFISSIITPTVPFLLLLIKSDYISPIFLLLSSIPFILSFIFLSYLLRDSITRDPNKMGIFHYIGKLSRHLLPYLGITYYLSTISFISSEFYLLLYFLKEIDIYLVFIPYLIILIFLLFNLFDINIESKFEEIISYLSFFLLIIILSFIYPINLNIENNTNIFSFSLIYFSSIFSGIDLLTYYSNYFNSKKTGNSTYYGTIIISILSFLLYLSFLNIRNSHFYTLILFLSLPFGILTTYIWFYTANNILKYISEEKLLPYIFRIKNRNDSPIFNIFLSTFLILILISIFKITDILSFFSIFTIIIYILYIISYNKIKLSSKYFSRKRFFKIFLSILALTIFFYYLFYYIIQNILILIISFFIFILSIFIALKITWKKNIKLIRFYFSYLYFLSYLFRKIFHKEDIKIIECFVKNKYKILDFGPFLGDISIEIAKKYNVKIYGIDISLKIIRKLLKKAKKLENYFVYIAKKDEIPKFLYDSIDLIIVYETLKFIIDKNKFVKNIYKALKNNGYLISINYVDIFEIKDFEEELEKIIELLNSYKIKTYVIKINKHLFRKYIIIGKKSV